ncbi:hypothetical protein JMJ78_0000254 [Colletotrichum scovillei]|nr:hypothetical protein JMJ78_0000254 [Colletotrichum scovillei]
MLQTTNLQRDLHGDTSIV